MAYMISESGDTPSYDDIYTICKKLGKEPDENTMTPEEYNSLPDDEKEEIHRVAIMNIDFSDVSDDIDTDEYWKQFVDWKKKNDVERDEDGYPIGWDHSKSKQRISGENNAILFVCEDYVEFGAEFTLGPGVHGQKQTHPYRKLGSIVFQTPEEADAEMKKRMDEMVKKFGLDKDKFRKIPTGAIPEEIRKSDPNAYGYIYQDTEGEGKVVHKRRGPKGKDFDGNDDGETSFTKKTKGYFIEYFVYRAKNVVKTSGKALTDLADKMSQIDDDE